MKRLAAYAAALWLLVVLAPRLAGAEVLAGRVVGVADGDTITVLDADNVPHEVRIQGIDAPEHDQAFGSKSKRNLSTLVFGKAVTAEYAKSDAYSRLVGKVITEGRDAGLEQIRAGMAWHYKQFQDEQTPEDRRLYADAEDAARRAQIGLWADAHPIPPWDFRHGSTSPLMYDKSGRRLSSQATGPVVGNRRSHIYQWPGCPYYGAIAPYNRVEFPSAQAAEQAGYRAARNCP